MPFAALLNGTLMPILLMLSPLAVMAIGPDGDGHPAGKTSPRTPCLAYRPPLM